MFDSILFSIAVHCFFFLSSLVLPAKQKESRYYLFMFHGWLSIDNIESQDEQGKIGETIAQAPLFMRFTINSHCIKSVVFLPSHNALQHLSYIPNELRYENHFYKCHHTQQNMFSIQLFFCFLVFFLFLCLYQRKHAIFISIFRGFLFIFRNSTVCTVVRLQEKKCFPGVIFVMFYIRLIGVSALSQNNLFFFFFFIRHVYSVSAIVMVVFFFYLSAFFLPHSVHLPALWNLSFTWKWHNRTPVTYTCCIRNQ